MPRPFRIGERMVLSELIGSTPTAYPRSNATAAMVVLMRVAIVSGGMEVHLMPVEQEQ